MDKNNFRSFLVLGVAIGLGMAFMGLSMSYSFYKTRVTQRFVTVKGLAERSVDADLAIWPLSFKETGNTPQLFSLQELQKDFKQLHEAMEDKHPAMYDHLSKSEFDRLFVKSYVALRDGLKLEEAFQVYASLLASVGCLHTNAWMPKGYWNNLSGKLFPIKMKFVGDTVLAVGSYHETDSLPPGAEVLTINNVPMAALLKDLRTVISADAYSDSYKNFRLGFRFPLLYSIFYGHPDQFGVTYRLPGSDVEKESLIRPVPTLRIWRNMRDPRRLDLDLKSEIETAVMTITDFSYYQEHDEFFGFIDSAFAEIAEKGIQNLILDLRLNSGGDPFCAAHLFSYIEHEPVPYFSKRYGKYSRLADPIALAENHFQGTLFILIDGGCASTTGHLCGLLKYHKIGTLIGEETGATYTCNDAHHSFLLEHTRFQIGIATGIFATAVKGMSKSQGILPDMPVEQTAEDLSTGKDTAFVYALNLCRNENLREKLGSDERQTALQDLPVYPELLEKQPNISSPVRDSSGNEFITAVTKDQKYILVPVTIENGEPYVYARHGKGKQLAVDAADFPTLAATGLHSDKELEKTQTITGRSIAEITATGRPEMSSGVGFMAQDEDIISVLKGDNHLAKTLGLTHPDLASAMFHMWNLVLEQSSAYFAKQRPWADVEYFFYNGKKVYFEEAHATKGRQESIFKDEIFGGYHIRIHCELDAAEKAFIEAEYGHLESEQFQELIQKLTRLHTGEIEPYYIKRYGFYEGHTDYRVDPIAIAYIFGLKSLVEIEAAFPGKLYEVLTSHFTR